MLRGFPRARFGSRLCQITYERSQIELWLSKKRTSPITGVPLAHPHLTPNLALKALIGSR